MSTRHEDRLLAALEQANHRSAEDKARIAMLETRLARIEQSEAPSAVTSSAEQRLVERMDRLIDLNHRMLLSERFQQPTDGAAIDAPASHGGGGAEPREQLRQLVERMYGGSSGFRGGLSVEQSEALKVLLRPERSLDTSNPWY